MRRLSWAWERWRALAALALALALVGPTIASVRYWEGRFSPGFYVLRNRLVPTVWLYSWTGAHAGVPFHARLLTADGEPVTDLATLHRAVAARLPGTPITWVMEKDGTRLPRVVPTMRLDAWDVWLTVGLFLLDGLLVFGAAIVVNLMQPASPAARSFLAMSTAFGTMLFTGPPLYHPEWAWLTPLHLVAQAAWPAGFIHWGLTFPVPWQAIVRRPGWLVLPYAIAGAIAAASVAGFDREPPAMGATYAAFAYTALGILACTVTMGVAYWRAGTPLVRPQLRAALPGFVLAAALAGFGYANISRAGGDFPMNLSMLMPIAFYPAAAYAIARHDLFDIDRFAKLAMAYATLTIAVTAVYASAVTVFATVPSAFNVVFVLVVAILFEPARRRVQRLVDRVFYRNRVDFEATVREVGAALTTLLDLDDVLTRVGRAVDEGLAPSTITVFLWSDGEHAWRLSPGAARPVPYTAAVPAPVRAHLEQLGTRPWLVGAQPEETAASHAAEALGAAVIVPLPAGERVIGAFALGRRRSGQPYEAPDLALLEALGAQCAVAVHNALAYRQLEELNRDLEGRVRDRTAALAQAQAQLVQSEKLAAIGQLVAGVAHEINTPVTAVVGNVPTLKRELATLCARAEAHADSGLAAAARRMAAALEVMARGAERTAGIVGDLRTFSRIDEPTPLSTDLHESLSVSLRLLHPRWADRIAIHTDFGDLPRIEATGQVNQVFLNLLANACDAIPGSGNIWVTTRAADDRVTVTIRDDGEGIPADVQGRIFDPFFTTKPLGQGTGLGLAISATVVRAHEGTIAVESSPGNGSTFTVTLPVRQHGTRPPDARIGPPGA